jgi:FtsZ-binding cell division protein ZapB
VLEKLASIEFSSWNLKGQSPSKFRHYGITAQDFFHLFGRDDYGTIGCDTLVNPIDMMGIAMSAIKGLKICTDQLKEINVELQIEQDHQQTQFDILFQENEILKEKINKLEEQMALFLKQREVNDVKDPTGPKVKM